MTDDSSVPVIGYLCTWGGDLWFYPARNGVVPHPEVHPREVVLLSDVKELLARRPVDPT